MNYLQAWTDLVIPYNPPPGWNNDTKYWFNVNPGDKMASEVTYDSDNGLWYLMIEDLSTGLWFGSDFNFNPNQNNAEWIVEVPPPNNYIGQYGTVSFSDCYWDNSSYMPQPINSNQNNALTYYIETASDGQVKPSTLDSNSYSFTMNDTIP